MHAWVLPRITYTLYNVLEYSHHFTVMITSHGYFVFSDQSLHHMKDECCFCTEISVSQ